MLKIRITSQLEKSSQSNLAGLLMRQFPNIGLENPTNTADIFRDILKYNSISQLVSGLTSLMINMIEVGEGVVLKALISEITSIDFWQEVFPNPLSRQVIWPVYDFGLKINEKLFLHSSQGEDEAINIQGEVSYIERLGTVMQQELQVRILKYRLHLLPEIFAKDEIDTNMMRLRYKILNLLEKIPLDFPRILTTLQFSFTNFFNNSNTSQESRLHLLRFVLALDLAGVSGEQFSFWDVKDAHQLVGRYVEYFGCEAEEGKLLLKLLLNQSDKYVVSLEDLASKLNSSIKEDLSEPLINSINEVLAVNGFMDMKTGLSSIVDEMHNKYLRYYWSLDHNQDRFEEYKDYCRDLWRIINSLAKFYKLNALDLKPQWDRILFAEIAYGDTSFVSPGTISRFGRSEPKPQETAPNRTDQRDPNEIETEEVHAVPANASSAEA